MLRYGTMLVLISVVLSSESQACSCRSLSRPCEYLLRDVAFVGQVLETRAVQHQRESNRVSPGYSMRFSVEETLRGDLGTEVSVETGSGGGDCGTPLRPGDRFLIFAFHGTNGELWTGLCSGNRELNGDPQNQQFLDDPGDVTNATTIGLDAGGEGDFSIDSECSYHLHASYSRTGVPTMCAKPETVAPGTSMVRARFVLDTTGDSCDLKAIDELAKLKDHRCSRPDAWITSDTAFCLGLVFSALNFE